MYCVSNGIKVFAAKLQNSLYKNQFVSRLETLTKIILYSYNSNFPEGYELIFKAFVTVLCYNKLPFSNLKTNYCIQKQIYSQNYSPQYIKKKFKSI